MSFDELGPMKIQTKISSAIFYLPCLGYRVRPENGRYFLWQKCNLIHKRCAVGKGIRYSDEFRQEVVNPIVVHGSSVGDVDDLLSISTKGLYDWWKKFSKPIRQRLKEQDLQVENAHLKRRFKIATGYKSIDFVQTLRVEKARHMLEEISDTVDQVTHKTS